VEPVRRGGYNARRCYIRSRTSPSGSRGTRGTPGRTPGPPRATRGRWRDRCAARRSQASVRNGPSERAKDIQLMVLRHQLEDRFIVTEAERQVADLLPIEADPALARTTVETVPFWFHTFALNRAEGIYTPGAAR